LKILTNTYPPRNIEAHHVFPQALKHHFIPRGINIHDPKYLAWWKLSSHRPAALSYNAKWTKFFRNNPEATLAHVLEEGKEIMSEYGKKTNY
jgi:hypothetical protein